nr:hypothetical protein [Tanacetum cinerariifolium]
MLINIIFCSVVLFLILRIRHELFTLLKNFCQYSKLDLQNEEVSLVDLPIIRFEDLQERRHREVEEMCFICSANYVSDDVVSQLSRSYRSFNFILQFLFEIAFPNSLSNFLLCFLIRFRLITHNEVHTRPESRGAPLVVKLRLEHHGLIGILVVVSMVVLHLVQLVSTSSDGLIHQRVKGFDLYWKRILDRVFDCLSFGLYYWCSVDQCIHGVFLLVEEDWINGGHEAQTMLSEVMGYGIVDECGFELIDGMNRSCFSHIVVDPIKIIPGPASYVQIAKLHKLADTREGGEESVMSTQEYIRKVIEDVGEDDDFTCASWLSVLDYVNIDGGIVTGCFEDVKKFLKNGKLEKVFTVIKSCTPNALDDLTVTPKDLSGIIFGTIHYKVLTEERFAKVITI